MFSESHLKWDVGSSASFTKDRSLRFAVFGYGLLSRKEQVLDAWTNFNVVHFVQQNKHSPPLTNRIIYLCHWGMH